MSYSIQGKVIDADKNPIPFALVYTSDASGKPVTPSKNTQTDDKGFWKLNDLKDTDLISVRNLGYKIKTFSAKNVPNVSFNQFMPPQRSVVTTLQPDEALNLQEVVVVADKVIPKKEDKKEDKKDVILPKKKNNYGLYVLIAGIAGVLLITTVLILNKKTTK
jgi:hypothetical protein